MKTIRMGNDVYVVWRISKTDQSGRTEPLDLSGAEVVLLDQCDREVPFEYVVEPMEDNMVQVVGSYYGKDQKSAGKYRLLLVRNKGAVNMLTLDCVGAFNLVPIAKFGVISGNDESSVTTAVVELETDMTVYNGNPDMMNYYTKDETDGRFVHKTGVAEEVITGKKIFTGEVEFDGPNVVLPDEDLIMIQYGGKSLESYVLEQIEEHGGGGSAAVDGETIKKIDDRLTAVNAKTEQAISVYGVNIGGYKDGDTIPVGAKLWDVVTAMLQQEIDVTVTDPTLTMTNGSAVGLGPYEVGTAVTPLFGETHTGGYFNGSWLPGGEIDAGCVWTNIRYYKGSVQFTNSSGYQFTVNEGNNSFSLNGDYSANTATATKNNGKPSEMSISAATDKASNTLTFTGGYKYFVGMTDETTIAGLTSAKVRGVTKPSALSSNNGWCTPDDTTTITTTMTNEVSGVGKSILLACPSKYELKAVTNGLGADILDNFSVTGTVTVSIGGVAIETYNVYIYPITNGAVVEFKGVRFS